MKRNEIDYHCYIVIDSYDSLLYYGLSANIFLFLACVNLWLQGRGDNTTNTRIRQVCRRHRHTVAQTGPSNIMHHITPCLITICSRRPVIRAPCGVADRAARRWQIDGTTTTRTPPNARSVPTVRPPTAGLTRYDRICGPSTVTSSWSTRKTPPSDRRHYDYYNHHHYDHHHRLHHPCYRRQHTHPNILRRRRRSTPRRSSITIHFFITTTITIIYIIATPSVIRKLENKVNCHW